MRHVILLRSSDFTYDCSHRDSSSKIIVINQSSSISNFVRNDVFKPPRKTPLISAASVKLQTSWKMKCNFEVARKYENRMIWQLNHRILLFHPVKRQNAETPRNPVTGNIGYRSDKIRLNFSLLSTSLFHARSWNWVLLPPPSWRPPCRVARPAQKPNSTSTRLPEGTESYDG